MLITSAQQREATIEHKLNYHRNNFIAHHRGIKLSLKALNRFLNAHQEEELSMIALSGLQSMQEKGEQLAEFAKQMIYQLNDIQVDDLSYSEELEEEVYQEIAQAEDRIENSDFPERETLEEIISAFKPKPRNMGLFERRNTL